MNKKEYVFLVKLLLFLGRLSMRILREHTGEYETYFKWSTKLDKLEDEYKKELS